MRHSYESAVFDLFHTIVDPEEFRPKSYRRVEFVDQALNLDLQSFTTYWSNTLALRTIVRSQTMVKLIEAYLALHGKTFDEEAVVRVDREMGRYQDMGNPESSARNRPCSTDPRQARLEAWPVIGLR